MAHLNDNFTLKAPVPVDDRKGWWDDATGEWKPFDSVQHALDTVVYYRYRTLTLPVVENGDVVEYWFKEGIEDSDFTLKTSQVDLSNYYTKTELQTSGSAQVHWDNLTNVPDLATETWVLSQNYITGVSWGDITGSQSVIGNAGFTNDAGYITLGDLPSPLTFENGLREDNGVVKLGLDPATFGTTNEGILTESTLLVLGDLSSPSTFIQIGEEGYNNIIGLNTLDGSGNTSSLYLGGVDNVLTLQRSLNNIPQNILFRSDGTMIVGDDVNSKGLEEASDYSANKTQYSYVTLKMLNEVAADIPDLTGYATEQWVLDQNYLTSVSSSWNINTGDLTIQGDVHNLDGRYMLRSNTITSGYGITASSDFTGPVNIEVNTTILDNRYLRKDVNDSNGSFNLTLGTLNVGDTSIDGTLNISSIATGLITDDLLIRDAATGDIKSIPMPSFGGGSFAVADASGSVQFVVNAADRLRFEGTGDASISFSTLATGDYKITVSSTGGSGSSGIQSVFGRTTPNILAVAGDYNTSQVTETTNLYFTQARVRATPLTGFSATNSAITATDNILQAFGKAQGQINARVPTSRQITISGTSGNITVGGGNTQNLASNPSWTINLATVGTAGTYTKVVTDAYGRVTAGGALTVSDLPPNVFQTLSTGNIGQMGLVSISGGNSVNINSIGFNGSFTDAQEMIDQKWSLSNNSGLTTYSHTTGATGFPSDVGAGIMLSRYSGTTAKSGFLIDRATAANDKLYYANIAGDGVLRAWQTFASESWVLEQLPTIPTNYVTTNTNQPNIGGWKAWTGSYHRWAPSATAPALANSIGMGAGSTGAWLQGWGSSGSSSWLLRGYTSNGVQLVLSEGGIEVPSGGTSNPAIVSNGVTLLRYSASNNVLLSADNGGVYLRPTSSGSTINEAIFGTDITFRALSGSGTQMVTVNSSGVLSRQAIPDVSGYLPLTGGTLTGNLGINTYLSINRGTSGYIFNISGTGYSTYNRIELGRTDGSTTIRVNSLSGSGNRMVVANANGDLSTQAIPAVGVTSVAAGNGMNFTTITGTGSVTLGTPGTLTSSTGNSVSSTSHTHALGTTVFLSIGSLGSTNLNDITQAGSGAQTTAAEATTARNYPIAGGGGTVISTAAVNNYRTQFFNERAANRMFWRGFNGSGWSAWKEFYHTGNFANGTTSQYIRGNGTLATFPSIPTVNNGTLTMSTGTGLSGSATFTANQSGNSTFTVALDNTVLRTTGNQTKSGVLTLSNELLAHSLRFSTAAVSGTTINMAAQGLLRLSSISSNTTYTMSNNADGRQVQCAVSNSNSSNSVTVTVTGAVLLGNNIIPANSAAVISIINFGGSIVRYTVISSI